MAVNLAELTDWELLANIVTVFTPLALLVGAAWRFRHWLATKLTHARTPPTPPPTTPRIGPLDTPTVIGRAAEVAALHARLRTEPRLVLTGQGGIGKTTLARHFARTHAADYDGILATLAATRQNVIDGLCAAGPALGLPLPDQPKEHDATATTAALTERIARTGRPWLILFDNVEARGDLDGMIPEGAHVLVTTRQGTGWAGWGLVPTATLDHATPDAPAVRLLMDHAGRTDAPQDARALAEALGGLPLALVVMGAWLRDQGLGFAEGRARLAQVLPLAPPNAGYPESLMGALRLSYDRLPDDARTLARLLSYWAPEGLGPALLLDAPGGGRWGECLALIPDPVQALAHSDTRTRAAFTALAARSLITGTGEARTLHRLTAACLRTLDAGELAPAAVALLAAAYPYDSDHSSNFPLGAKLTPHVQALLASGAAPNIAAWDFLLNHAGLYLSAVARYQDSLQLAQANLKAKQGRGLPESDADIAIAHANLGGVWWRLREWELSEIELTRALKLAERYHPNSADHASTLNLLGGLMLDRISNGETDRICSAIRLNQQALAIRKRVAGRRSDALAEALNNLGVARNWQGRREAAARLFGAGLKIRRAILPPGDTRLTFGLVNLGALLLRSGEAAQAEPLLREALEIQEIAFDAHPKHPDRLHTANGLILCLLVRARAGVNRGLREAEARQLCARYGFDYAERLAEAQAYPLTPSP